MTRGELARRADVHPETLRYYERRGLLTPAGRTAAGYRVYDEQAVERLAFVRAAQEVGFSLDEASALLRLRVDPDADRAEVRARTAEKLADVERRIAELERMRDALHALLDACDGEGPAASCPILVGLSNPIPNESHGE